MFKIEPGSKYEVAPPAVDQRDQQVFVPTIAALEGLTTVENPQTPVEYAEELILIAALPAHVGMLESIQEALDDNDWEGAMKMGLAGALTSIGTHFDYSIEKAQAETPGNAAEHPKVADAKSALKDAAHGYDMAERILEKEHPRDQRTKSSSAHAEYSEEDRRDAIRQVQMYITHLIHALKELPEPGKPAI